MVFIWGYGSRDTARMCWQLGCESFFPNYNSQEALDAHSPRDVTAAEGEGSSGNLAYRLLGGYSRTPALARVPRWELLLGG